MDQKLLNDALTRGILVTFKTVGERERFFKELKSFGGRWINGLPLTFNEKLLNSSKKNIACVHVDKNYVVANVSGMCLHFGAYASIPYTQLVKKSYPK